MVSRCPSGTATMSAMRPPMAAGPMERADSPLKVSESTVTSCAAARTGKHAMRTADAKRRRRFSMSWPRTERCGRIGPRKLAQPFSEYTALTAEPSVPAPRWTQTEVSSTYFLGSSGLAAGGAGGGILKMESSTGTLISIFETVSFSFSVPPFMPFSMAKGYITPLTSL